MGVQVETGLRADLIKKLNEIQQQLFLNEGYPFDPEALKLALQEIVRGRFGSEVLASKKALEFIADIALDAITTGFVFREKFREGTVTDGVRIAWLSPGTKEHFLDRVEGYVPRVHLKVHRLVDHMKHSRIITELGDRHETTLAHLWQLLKLQGSGQAGPLLIHTFSNVIPVRDASGVLWMVSAYYDKELDGWCISVDPIDSPKGRCAGTQVLSCNSHLGFGLLS